MTALTPWSRRDGNLLALVLASDALARLVMQFVLHPGSSLHFQALKRATGLPNRSLQNELRRLEQLGMVRRDPDRRLVRYPVRPDHPRWRALRELVGSFADPGEVLRIAIAQVPGIETAFIYGSHVRSADVHPESDVDVMVVGDHVDDASTRFALAASALDVAGLIGREVNVTRYTPRRLRARWVQGGRFVRSVLAGEKRWLVGDERTLVGHLGDAPADDALDSLDSPVGAVEVRKRVS